MPRSLKRTYTSIVVKPSNHIDKYQHTFHLPGKLLDCMSCGLIMSVRLEKLLNGAPQDASQLNFPRGDWKQISECI
jgi:hypothetical protein